MNEGAVVPWLRDSRAVGAGGRRRRVVRGEGGGLAVVRRDVVVGPDLFVVVVQLIDVLDPLVGKGIRFSSGVDPALQAGKGLRVLWVPFRGPEADGVDNLVLRRF